MKKSLLLLPGPVPVAQPVLEAMARPLINHRSAEFGSMLARITQALLPVFGTTRADVLLLGSSGTGGLETAVANLFAPGDVLLSCAVGVFGKRLAAIAQAYGCTVDMLPTQPGAAVDPEQLRAHLAANPSKYAGILLTQNETSTGVQNDMAALAPIVRAYGALSVVDAVSGLGAAPFAMDEWGYDVVVTASQKAFAAPPGVAMIAVGERAWQRMETLKTPRFYFDLQRARKSAGSGETPWTPPISILYAVDVALQRYHAEGMEAVFERHARYAGAVRSALEALGFTSFSRPGAHSVTVVAAYPPEGTAAPALLQRLRERYGVVLSGGQMEFAGKIVRFGTMGDVNEGDLIGAIGAIELALADIDASFESGAGVKAALEKLTARTAVTA